MSSSPDTSVEPSAEKTDYVVEAEHAQQHTKEGVVDQDVDDDADFKFTLGKFMAILGLQLGYFVDIFTLVAGSSILEVINDDLGPNTNFFWISSSQTVSNSVLFPLFGRLGDIFGRRWFIFTGSIFSLIGCAMSARATSIDMMIGAGILIGVGGSLHQLCWSGLGEIVPKRSRGKAFGCLEGSIAIAQSFAPEISNALAAKFGWRYVFWIPFSINIIAMTLIFFFYHPRNQYIKEVGRTRAQQVLDLDWVGVFLFTSGLVLFLLGISFGGSTFPWKSAGTLAPLLIGLLLLVCFGVYEAKVDQTFPLMPVELFTNVRGFTVVCVGTFLYGMLYYAVGVIWPQQVQALYTTDRYKIGWYVGIQGLAGIISAPFQGLFFRKIGHARYQFVFWIFVMTLCTACGAIVSPTSNVASTILVGLATIAISCVSIIGMTIIQVNVKHEFLGIAAALSSTSRNVGGAVGTTIYSTILATRVTSNIVPDVAVPLAKAGVPLANIPGVIVALTTGKGLSALATLTPTQLGVAVLGIKWAYAHAFRTVYLVSLAFGVVGIITVCFTADCDRMMTREVQMSLAEGAHVAPETDTGKGHFVEHHTHHLVHGGTAAHGSAL